MKRLLNFVSPWAVGAIAVWLLVIVIAVNWGFIRPLGHRLPSSGEPQVGVGYRVTFYCPASFAIGDTWWDFDGWDLHGYGAIKWPPPLPGNNGDPAEVPGILTLTSNLTGNFVADVDRSVLPVSRSPRGGLHAGGCL
jgi:hypothetical protein